VHTWELATLEDREDDRSSYSTVDQVMSTDLFTVHPEDIIDPTERELDATELEAIAELTGARFFRARDKDALEAVYAEIEAAERPEREEQRYTETFDLDPPFLILAAVLHLLAWISSATWARRLP
jgi:Ca-activated chloride channel family protein